MLDLLDDARGRPPVGSPAWPRSPAPSPVTRSRPPERSGPRQPCPCGSGQRYKACHGAAGGAPAVYVGPPVRGDAVGVRRGRAARAGARGDRTADPEGRPRPVSSSSARCCRWPRPRWCATAARSGSASRCSTTSATRPATSARCSTAALDAEPGIVGLTDPPGEGPRLQDLIIDDVADVTVHDGFDFWIADVDGDDRAGAGGRARAGQLRGQPDRPADHRRGGVLDQRRPQGAPALGDAGARGRRSSTRSPGCTPPARTGSSTGSRFVGMFRAHGLLAPVWDLPGRHRPGGARGAGGAVRRRPRRGAGRRLAT